jgi:hypothetical protein
MMSRTIRLFVSSYQRGPIATAEQCEPASVKFGELH